MQEELYREESLFEYIKRHITDGRLPADFSLPEKEEAEAEGKLRFADGALDGITMYHMMGSTLTAEEKEEMRSLIFLISDGEIQEADEALCSFAKRHRTLSVIDEFEDTIRQNREVLNAPALYRYGVRLLVKSAEPECVKFGMAILELFIIRDEKVKEAIRILGLSNEFSLFALFLMQQWENANEEIFELAKKVTGWGRVHAVEKLEPETEEIRDWFLKEGIKNQVLPDYSALTCFEKAKVKERLSGNLTEAEFSCIGEILDAMLTEGPVPGISAVEDCTQVLERYLVHARNRALSPENEEIILRIKKYIDDKKEND